MTNKEKLQWGKSPGKCTTEDRKIIIEDYLNSNQSKVQIWFKYFGKADRGTLLNWMRELGYIDNENIGIFDESLKNDMAENKNIRTVVDIDSALESAEIFQLKEKIKQLEQALVNSELRATSLETIIEVAEKELKINLKKNSPIKPFRK
jgi:hypothetical protein